MWSSWSYIYHYVDSSEFIFEMIIIWEVRPLTVVSKKSWTLVWFKNYSATSLKVHLTLRCMAHSLCISVLPNLLIHLFISSNQRTWQSISEIYNIQLTLPSCRYNGNTLAWLSEVACPWCLTSDQSITGPHKLWPNGYQVSEDLIL